MSDLNRNTAALDTGIWHCIDAATLEAAAERLTARRLLDVDGPYGLGLTSLETAREERIPDETEAGDDMAVTVGSRALPVPLLQQPCTLSVRRVEDAAEAVARREEHMVYHGVPRLGRAGLTTVGGRAQSVATGAAALRMALINSVPRADQLPEWNNRLRDTRVKAQIILERLQDVADVVRAVALAEHSADRGMLVGQLLHPIIVGIQAEPQHAQLQGRPLRHARATLVGIHRARPVGTARQHVGEDYEDGGHLSAVTTNRSEDNPAHVAPAAGGSRGGAGDGPSVDAFRPSS